MFFVLSKLLGYLIFPLTLALLGLVVFWLRSRRRPKPAWRLFWAAVVVLWFCSCPWGTDVLLLPLERPFTNAPEPATADVIIVLGGALDLVRSEPGRLEYGPSSDRFMYAVLLARRLPQAKIIFSGGTASLVDHAKTEASLLKGEAIRLGIEPERIYVDDASRNTRENAIESKRILEQIGGQSVVVITTAFHMRRSLGCLRKVGMEATPYAVDFRNHRGGANLFGWVPQADQLVDSTAAIREYVGLVMYRLKGWAS
ncbi:YdcF family protein [bacterium]|nr:YdcF family protein [bacterium]